MLALGILAIIQAGFLPGYLLVRLLGLADGLLRTAALSIALSLLLNHLLVCVLVAGRIFSPEALYLIFAAECVLLLALFVRDRSRIPWPPGGSDGERIAAMCSSLKASSPLVCIIGSTAIAAGLFTIGWCLWLAIANVGTVFEAWDAVVSWNRWALDWYANKPPELTWHYPQLLPTTYALTYGFIQTTDVQFFARGATALFPLAMVFALVDVGLRLRDVRILFAAPLALYLLRAVAIKPMSGQADEPVAAMITLAVCCIFWAKASPSISDARRLLAIGAMLAAAAALTKQAGWLIAVMYPLLAWIHVLRTRDLRWHLQLGHAAILLGLIVLVAGPWYVYLKSGEHVSEIPYITGTVHAGRGYLERAAHGAGLLARSLRVPLWVVYYALPALVIAALVDRRWRSVTLLVVIPLTVIWAMFVSISERNIAGAVPLGAVSLIVGSGVVLGACRFALLRLQPGIGRPWVFYIASGAALAAAVGWLGTTEFRSSRLRQRQYERQWQIPNTSINAMLREYYTEHGFATKVLTNYQIMGFLPEVNRHYHQANLASEISLIRALEETGGRYILFFGVGQMPLPLQKRVDAGEFVLIRQVPQARLFKMAEQER